MLFMYVALLNDNSLKHIYTLSIICASFTNPVFLRVFRSVYNSPFHIIYSYTHCNLGDPDTLQPHKGDMVKFVVCSVSLNSSVVRVLARYARDPGFDSQLRHDFSPPVSFIYICMYVVYIFSTVE